MLLPNSFQATGYLKHFLNVKNATELVSLLKQNTMKCQTASEKLFLGKIAGSKLNTFQDKLRTREVLQAIYILKDSNKKESRKLLEGNIDALIGMRNPSDIIRVLKLSTELSSLEAYSVILPALSEVVPAMSSEQALSVAQCIIRQSKYMSSEQVDNKKLELLREELGTMIKKLYKVTDLVLGTKNYTNTTIQEILKSTEAPIQVYSHDIWSKDLNSAVLELSIPDVIQHPAIKNLLRTPKEFSSEKYIKPSKSEENIFQNSFDELILFVKKLLKPDCDETIIGKIADLAANGTLRIKNILELSTSLRTIRSPNLLACIDNHELFSVLVHQWGVRTLHRIMKLAELSSIRSELGLINQTYNEENAIYVPILTHALVNSTKLILRCPNLIFSYWYKFIDRPDIKIAKALFLDNYVNQPDKNQIATLNSQINSSKTEHFSATSMIINIIDQNIEETKEFHPITAGQLQNTTEKLLNISNDLVYSKKEQLALISLSRISYNNEKTQINLLRAFKKERILFFPLLQNTLKKPLTVTKFHSWVSAGGFLLPELYREQAIRSVMRAKYTELSHTQLLNFAANLISLRPWEFNHEVITIFVIKILNAAQQVTDMVPINYVRRFLRAINNVPSNSSIFETSFEISELWQDFEDLKVMNKDDIQLIDVWVNDRSLLILEAYEQRNQFNAYCVLNYKRSINKPINQ